MRHFSDESIPLLLCKQLLELMNKLQEWTETGTKDSKGDFKFYLSDIQSSTFVLLKAASYTDCFVKLFSNNGLRISDEKFCQETENWLRNLAVRATLISVSSEKERFKFFRSQKQKVEDLMETLMNEKK